MVTLETFLNLSWAFYQDQEASAQASHRWSDADRAAAAAWAIKGLLDALTEDSLGLEVQTR